MSSSKPAIQGAADQVRARGYLEARVQQFTTMKVGARKPEDVSLLDAQQSLLLDVMRDLCGCKNHSEE